MEKVFITKYALTKGILEKEVKIQDHGNGYIRAYEKGGFPSYSLGKECFRDIIPDNAKWNNSKQ